MCFKQPICFCLGLVSFYSIGITQEIRKVREITVGDGWANNSVNTVVFRKNALCSYQDTQYISYYNKNGFVVLGKRTIPSAKWDLYTTTLRGNVSDAHNSISMMVDGDGFLHLSWDQHNSELRYCRSVEPGSLEMTGEMEMTGENESRVTYPEFYSLPGGDLLFLYRNGESGQGNLVVNRYDVKEMKWTQLHSNLIDGEKKRNAYWQACVDKKGTIHLSWVWRETPDVSSNHDLCYARSKDGGVTWENSNGEIYSLPINAANAEYACRIPGQSELINQTSMSADEDGQPVIASYWREAEEVKAEGEGKDGGKQEVKVRVKVVPQYHIVYKNNGKWVVDDLGFRRLGFSLSGRGTKRIPIARPQVIAWKKNDKKFIAVIFRDEERGSRISIAVKKLGGDWKIEDLSKSSVGSWEPLYDTELWMLKKQLHLFVQYSEQQDAEGMLAIAPTEVKVIEVKKLD
jgi:hypothetical protein